MRLFELELVVGAYLAKQSLKVLRFAFSNCILFGKVLLLFIGLDLRTEQA
jgi:hypothetical protein